MNMRWLATPSSASSFSLSALALIAALFPADAKQKNSSLGKLPSCDAGAPQVVECTGPVTAVQLDGTGSTNPVQGELTYKWEFCNDPRVWIDDPTSPTPTLFVELQADCSLTCTVYLAVRNRFGVTSCSTLITVQDTTAPVITCPPDVTVLEGDPTDPGATGTATATDLRDPNPIVGHVDDLSQLPDRILRVWTADDGCQTSSCTQVITIEAAPPTGPHFDIHPGSCPNPLNVNAGSAALVSFPTALLGNDFDVTQVDLDSLTLSRSVLFQPGPSVPPDHLDFADSATPFEGDLCGCNAYGADGTLDLTLHFDLQDVVSVLDLDLEPDGTVLELQLNGLLLDGTPFTARDCVKIINK